MIEHDGYWAKTDITFGDEFPWVDCEIYVYPNKRLSDMVNQEFKFLPIRREGKFYLINKDQIKFMTDNK